MFDKILRSPPKPVATCRKSSISDVWRGLELTFVSIFAELLRICLLNLINIFHHVSNKYSIVNGQIHMTLMLKYLLNNENYNSIS